MSEPRTAEDALETDRTPSRLDGGVPGAALVPAPEPIAIVGMAFRLPGGASDPDSFWALLRDGRDAVRKQRFPRVPLGYPERATERWGGFIDDIDRFDAAFFRLSPREAELMDPQHRLFLETAWHALEDAGIRPSSLAGTRTGVYAGVCNYDYNEILQAHMALAHGAHAALGTSPALLANRISFLLDLRGPSETIDTASSSSLVALHHAVQGLRRGDCDQALIGGVNLLVSSRIFDAFGDAGMLGRKGRCRTFDAGADGYVRGEGVAVLVLKPLARACADGDRIHGVIRHTVQNHGGRASSMTSPNPEAQTELLVAAYETAGIPIESISYFEAHGTGTPVGDPIEVQALKQACARLRRDADAAASRRVALGSVKSNIGHLEAAAALSGLVKLLVCLQQRKLSPTVHFERLNPDIDLAGSPFYIVDALQDWAPAEDEQGVPWPRRAGLSSFGFGGANAHAILEEWADVRADVRAPARPRPQALVLSARTPAQLAQLVDALRAEVARRSMSADELESLAYTSQVGREPMRERIAFLVDGPDEVARVLAEDPFTSARIVRGRVRSAQPGIGAREVAGDVAGDVEGIPDAHRLARQWVDGRDVDWALLYPAARPPKTAFPRYPFARDRHWFTDDDLGGDAMAGDAPAGEPLPGDAARAPASPAGDLFCALPRWQDAPLTAGRAAGPATAGNPALIVLASIAPTVGTRIADAFPASEIVSLGAGDANGGDDGEAVPDRFVRDALRLFQRVRARLEARPREPQNILVLVRDSERAVFAHAPLLALLRSAYLENPNIRARLVTVEGAMSPEQAPAQLIGILARESAIDNELPAEIRYAGGTVRQQRVLREISISDIVGDIGGRDPGGRAGVAVEPGGVYWIVGGLGGLGRIVARHLARVPGIALVLTGRSPLDEAGRAELDDLRRSMAMDATGTRGTVEYMPGDVSVLDEVRRVAAAIRDRHGRLDGVVHAAGVLRDAFLLRKSEDDFRAVLAPKVHGVAHLDLATRDFSLDFFAVFSSFTTCLGGLGQADYAAANAFVGGYAEYRQRLVRQGARAGKTLSIDWPLWRDGGMGLGQEVREHLRHRLGMLPMKTETGLRVFDQLLAGPLHRLLVIEGDMDEIRGRVLHAAPAREPRVSHDHAAQDTAALRAGVVSALKALLASTTKIPESSIDETESLEMYGIDSILMGHINRALDEVLGDNLVSKTLLYEYRTVAELSDYFVSEHPDAAAVWVGRQGGASDAAPAAPAAPAASAASEVSTVPAVPAMDVSGQASGHAARDIGPGAPAPVAIIGLAGRYPGAAHARALWPLLRDGKEAIGVIPADRWDADACFVPDKDEAGRQGKSYSKWGGFIDGFDEFDCLLFNVSPREALNIDPQERKFLECCWELVEDAGYTREALRGQTVGVYAGITKTGFDLHRTPEREAGGVVPQTSFSSLANRVSYVFDFHGPSMPVDTMCSASLTAIHLACEHIHSGACDLAIAGGVNLYLHPSSYAYLCRMRMLSDDGKNRSFGRGGNGFVPGEGVGAVLLKRLDRAEADGDIIYGVIRGSAINHGGRTAGYTVPNPNAQRDLVSAALARAGVDARTVSYIEAHGTGTELGDPIEIAGLSHAFRRHTEDRGFCAIGSVKSNIGHLEAAAGIAGVSKVLLQLAHGTLAPSLHAEALNPNINFELSPFQVQRTRAPWRRPVVGGQELPRRAGISSFGAGGSNAHVVIEEYMGPRAARPWSLQEHGLGEDGGAAALIVLSAKTEDSLRAYAARLARFLIDGDGDGDDGNGDDDARAGGRVPRLVDIAYTLMVGREAMEQRAALVVTSTAALARALASFAAGHDSDNAEAGVVVMRGVAGQRGGGGSADAATVAAWIEARRLGELGAHWCGGGAVDWRALHTGNDARRVSLPTYAFARRRIWFERSGEAQADREPSPSAAQERTAASRDADAAGAQASQAQAAEPRRVRLSSLRAPAAAPRQARVRARVRLAALDELPVPGPSSSGPSLSGSLASEPPRAAPASRGRQAEVLAQLRTQLAQLLFLSEDEIGEHETFVALGLDSIIGVEWIRIINRHFGLTLSATKLYDYPTLAELSGFLAGFLAGLQTDAPADAAAPRAPATAPSNAPEPAPAPAPAPEIDDAPAPALPAPGASELAEIQRTLTRQLAGLLFLQSDEIRDSDAFVELGLDSIIGVEWIRIINQSFGLTLSATKLYDHPTVRELARFVAASMPPQASVAPAITESRVAGLTPTREATALGGVGTPPRPQAEGRGRTGGTPPRQPAPATPRYRADSTSFGKPAGQATGKVAIVGMSGRFPGARDVDQLWQNLAAGVHSVVEMPSTRWDADAYFDPASRGDGKVYARWLGALDGVDEFDPFFFSLSPAEAECMDPQQRLFLQEAWKAFEDAGYARASLDGVRCGTYVGIMTNDYWHLLARSPRAMGMARTMLGNSNAIAAARIAYLLNLEGPAIAVDTACSSSLVAAHLAHRALVAGDVDVALVGGVTLYLSVEVYKQMCEAGMLSARGRCHAFDHRADGIVPGEAATALVLKRLEDAVAAGDHVYGVIAGSGINQDGKTNGITAPSARAQMALQRRVYGETGISPDTIGYVEAHGTGTKLGDPIEWEALTTVWREHTTRSRFCAIGSVKSNLGHTAAAAGLVGLQKVLLSLRHGQIPPTINFERGNEHIDFDDTPFYVNTSLQPWPAAGDAPRRAAINSFGFSGTNAHLIVEEYIDSAVTVRARSVAPGPYAQPVLIPLSAKKADRLPVMAARLSACLNACLNAGQTDAGQPDAGQPRAGQNAAFDLRDVAYTLQVGRQAMEHRVAFVARDAAELRAQLDAFAAGKTGLAGVYLGQVGKDRQVVQTFEADEDLQEALGKWMAKGKLGPLAELWTKGLELTWETFHQHAPGKRIPLPTYPFATDRYWVPEAGPAGEARRLSDRGVLHPLVHENTSVFGEQRFSTRLSGEERMLQDHRVAGQRILPGVAQLEMVRAAVALSGRPGTMVFHHVLWADPLVVDGDGRIVEILLRPDGDEIRYEIHSSRGSQGSQDSQDGDAAGRRMHGRGRVAVMATAAPGVLPREADVAQRYHALGAARYPAEAVHGALAAQGIEYGPGFRAIEELRVGPDVVLARLCLPSCWRDDGLALHPGMVDAALQATIGFALASQGATGESTKVPAGQPYLPFSAHSVELLAPTPAEAYAIVRRAQTAGSDPALRRFDVDLVDTTGAVCVRFRSFALRAAGTHEPRAIEMPAPGAPALAAFAGRGGDEVNGQVDDQASGHVLWAATRWQPSPLRPAPAREPAALPGPLIVLAGLPAPTAQAVQDAALAETHVIPASASASAAGSAAEYAFATFAAALAVIKDAMRQPSGEPRRVVAVVPGGPQAYCFAPLAGLLKTARLETAKLRPTLVTLEDAQAMAPERVRALVAQELAPGLDDLNDEVMYDAAGVRLVKQRIEVDPAGAASAAAPVRPGGVYWITGGMGGLGMLVARHLCAAAPVTVVLSGRSPLTADLRAHLAELQRPGCHIEYIQADCGDRQQVASAYAAIGHAHGRLDGIVHSAGVLRDALLVNKDEAGAREVFRAKVDAAVHLDALTRDDALDFLVLFSSMAGVLGNVGQADYAAANAFLDAFAAHRNRLVARGERRGRTVSIAWPLWRDGGMRIDAQAEQRLARTKGLVGLRPDAGLRAFDLALAQRDHDQLVVMAGDRARIRALLGMAGPAQAGGAGPRPGNAHGAAASVVPGAVSVAAPGAVSEAEVRAEIIGILCDLLKLQRGDIDVDTELADYGIDSIAMMGVLDRLEQTYDAPVDPSAMVDHPNVAALARFLIAEGIARPAPAPLPDQAPAPTSIAASGASAISAPAPAPAPASALGPAIASAGARTSHGRSTSGKVAIIGVSCRLPGSSTPEAFWDNLAHGRDLITEVPPGRWLGHAVLSPDRAQRDKTYTNKAGYLDDIAAFDAAFFGIDEDDALALDPQQRITLELAQELLDRAGYDRDEVAGTRTSVILGAKENNYVRNNYHRLPAPALKRAIVNTIGNMIASRVSDFYDLRGPSKTLDTACSSSLVAVHDACDSVLSGESQMAIAGGIFLLADPFAHIGFSRAGVLSDDGRSYVFDERAKGFVLGEGAALVLLKEYDAAVRDGDDILAVIRGSAVNNDGRTMGLTVPNQDGQKAVIVEALRRSGVDPGDITCYEAHGTGTLLGDPIEVKAATQVYRTYTDRRQYCAIGSVKSNLGHTMTAAGVVSLLKVVLGLQHRQIPATLHCARPHARFRFDESPFFPNTELRDWLPPGVPRLAAISSFGFGGTNCHMIVEEAR